MAQFRNPLAHVRVAAPCKADWDQMIGSERVRFCGQCSLNVYNLSAMTRPDAETLIARTEGRLCVRFYRRPDGSIITKDCPVGLCAIRQRVSYVAKAITSMVLGLFAGLGVLEAFSNLAPFVPERTMGVIAGQMAPRGELDFQGQIVSPIQPPAPLVMMGSMPAKPIRHRPTSGLSRSVSNRRS